MFYCFSLFYKKLLQEIDTTNLTPPYTSSFCSLDSSVHLFVPRDLDTADLLATPWFKIFESSLRVNGITALVFDKVKWSVKRRF